MSNEAWSGAARIIPTDLVDETGPTRHAGQVIAPQSTFRSPFNAVRRLQVDLMRLGAAGCSDHG
jgi:hypothetical protein